MSIVYIVTHTHELPSGNEDIKFIGVYDSQESAEEAVKRACLKAGFSETQDGFFIESYQLGKDHWTDGFFTYMPSNDIKSK
ncbi:hypothetical protein B0D71_17830 [Pseudomonas laurylsulfativorans]|uniref:DUF7336 domain-containing protein n=1 Tax=Pseudomonas laurylsulfativorans TaxID=1943631 RepID=A0A2S3VMA3_9PSED|nr:hypothetical protein [Pseudomonas laurylsulfativorans]POF41097.1 hypothetical protein B0D71_17830 [Pseudomonas laurylsulfativorans]